MIAAVNVEQSKSVSVAFVSLKSMILGMIMTVSLDQNSTSFGQQCTSKIMSFSTILTIFYSLGIIVDGFCLAYFFCKKQFKKIEYYVFYLFHIILSLMCIVGSIFNINQYSGCEAANSFFVGVIVASLVFQINGFVIMLTNLFSVLKFIHFGSNIVWAFLWFSQMSTCSSLLIGLVGGLHLISSFINFLFFVIELWRGKFSLITELWKLITLISVFVMILCYLILLIGLVDGETCVDAKFIDKVYERYGILEIISPILILVFLRGEKGDPRQKIIKSYNETFYKLSEYDSVNNEEKS